MKTFSVMALATIHIALFRASAAGSTCQPNNALGDYCFDVPSSPFEITRTPIIDILPNGNGYTISARYQPAPLMSPAPEDQTRKFYALVQKSDYYVGLNYTSDGYFHANHWLRDHQDSLGHAFVSVLSKDQFLPGSYYHVAMVFDRTRGSLRLYVDSLLQGETFFPVDAVQTVDYSTSSWRVGSSSGGPPQRFPAKGLIRDISLFDRALSEGQIKSVTWTAEGPTTEGAVIRCGLTSLINMDSSPSGDSNCCDPLLPADQGGCSASIVAGPNPPYEGSTCQPDVISPRYPGHCFDVKAAPLELAKTSVLATLPEGNEYSISARYRPTPPTNPVPEDQTRKFHAIVQNSEYYVGLNYTSDGHFHANHWFRDHQDPWGHAFISVLSADRFPPGLYYHLTMVFDRTRGSLRLYVDGVLQGESFFPTDTVQTVDYNTSLWRVGSSAGGQSKRFPANGLIYDVGLFNEALSEGKLRLIAGTYNGAKSEGAIIHCDLADSGTGGVPLFFDDSVCCNPLLPEDQGGCSPELGVESPLPTGSATCSTTSGLGSTSASCDDNNACTSNSCHVSFGCVNEESCDDDDPGTIDSCDPEVGCVYTPCPPPRDNECINERQLRRFVPACLALGLETYSTEDCEFGCENNACRNVEQVMLELSQEGSAIDGIPAHNELLRAYPSGELAVHYIINGKLEQARHVLEPAVEAALSANGRLTRWYSPQGEPASQDNPANASNGDASVISIAFGMYLHATATQTSPDGFLTRLQDANLLVQGWLHGRQTVQISNGEIRHLTKGLGGTGVFRYQREDRTSISAENEIRRAISLWYADEQEAAKELTLAIWEEMAQVVHPNDQLSSDLLVGEECARDAFSLIVLAMDGMGIMTSAKREQLERVAIGQPCYVTSTSHQWFGYFREEFLAGASPFSATPEYMYSDAEALRVLGLDSQMHERKASADKLAEAIGFGYSEEYPNSPRSAITFIMRAIASDALHANHYFGLH